MPTEGCNRLKLHGQFISSQQEAGGLLSGCFMPGGLGEGACK